MGLGLVKKIINGYKKMEALGYERIGLAYGGKTIDEPGSSHLYLEFRKDGSQPGAVVAPNLSKLFGDMIEIESLWCGIADCVVQIKTQYAFKFEEAFHYYSRGIMEAKKVSDFEKGKGRDLIEKSAGIIVPGGFGSRGIEGKILAAKFARENKIPYLGLCLGMQLMCVEFARNVL